MSAEIQKSAENDLKLWHLEPLLPYRQKNKQYSYQSEKIPYIPLVYSKPDIFFIVCIQSVYDD